MVCSIRRSRLSGEITCPASKSYTHRAIFLASLACGSSTITGALKSEDTDATIAACRSMGAKIDRDGCRLTVRPGEEVQSASIDAANSGTTIRLSSAMAALAAG